MRRRQNKERRSWKRRGMSWTVWGAGLLLSGSGAFGPDRLDPASTAAAAEPRPLIVTRGVPETRTGRRIGQPGHERRTHRGWEVYGDRWIVLATTSLDDARRAAAEFSTAIDDAARRLSRITGPLPPGDRGRGAVQITIDGRRAVRADESAPTIRRVGYAQSVYLNVADGAPPLAAQFGTLHAAAGVLVVDSQLAGASIPEPIRAGLARHLSTPESDTAGLYQQLVEDSVPRGAHPWAPTTPPPTGRGPQSAERAVATLRSQNLRWVESPGSGGGRSELPGVAPTAARSAALRPAPTPPFAKQVEYQDGMESADGAEASEAAEAPASVDDRVEFLLTGYDGRFAPAFSAALQATLAGEARSDTGPLVRLMQALEPHYETWRQDRRVGVPEWTPLDPADESLVQKQREAVLVLRMLQRSGPTSAIQVAPKVISFGRDGRAEPQAPTPSGRPVELDVWVRQEARRSERWAVVDDRGALVWNDESDRLQEALGRATEKHSAEWRDGRLVVLRPLDADRTLEVWLEPGPPDRNRPTAKFHVRSAS